MFKSSFKKFKAFSSVNNKSGSLILEIVIILGLVASITPILYKQVSERRQDIDNLNEANTLLLLKQQVLDYIQKNQPSIAVGNTVLDSAAIGSDISGYRIGIRKESDGTVSAMIAPTSGGNDIQAGQIASLLGVSAGIYSAQDTAKAWGINGLWAENISNYGFSSLPTGIPVITTAYDEGDNINLDSVFSAVEEHSFDALTAKQFCIDNPDIAEDERCIEEWSVIGINPLEIIAQCNNDLTNGVTDSTTCAKGWEKHINRSCAEISAKYKSTGFNAPSGLYAITTSENTQVERACYFVNGFLPTDEQLIVGAKTDSIARRYDWENEKISTSCATIINNWASAPTDFYSHVTGINSYNANQPCVFPDTPVDTITQCNAANNTNHAACRYGWNKSYNRDCATLLTYYPAGKGKNNTISAASSVSTQCCSCDPCEGLNTACATLNNTCNSAGIGSNACKCAYNRNCNRACSSVTSYNSGRCSTSNIITNSSTGSGSWQTCSCCSLISGQTLSSNLTSPYTAPCTGYYTLCASGERSCTKYLSGNYVYTWGSKYCSRVYINKGEVIKATTYAGGWNPAGGWWGCTGGAGIVVFAGNTPILGAGGGTGSGCNNNGVCHVSGGSGYQGVCGYCSYSGDTSGACNGKGYLSGCGNQQNYCGRGSCWREADSGGVSSSLVYFGQNANN